MKTGTAHPLPRSLSRLNPDLLYGNVLARGVGVGTLTLLQSDLELVRNFENDVADTVVPLSYMEEFYNLRLHVAYIRSRLEERIAAAS